MGFAGEIIELGYDNDIRLILKSDGVAQSLSAVTQIKLIIGGTTYTSDNSSGKRILWDKAGYDTGEVRIMLGKAGSTGDTSVPTAGTYSNCPLIIYSATYDDGLRWGDGLNLKVR